MKLSKAQNETFEIIGKDKKGLVIESESASTKTAAVTMAKKIFTQKNICTVEVIDHVYFKTKDN